MRQRVVQALKPLHGFSVENPCKPGTPDVNYGGPHGGWIELKWEESWPKKPETPLVLTSTFTPQQRLFAVKRWHTGAKCHFLIQVDQDWLLFDGPTAARIVGTSPRAELERAALVHWHGSQMEKEIVQCLSHPREI